MSAGHVERIAAPIFNDVEPSDSIGERPQLEWLPKDWLFVDERYQRSAQGGKSRQIVRKLIEEFSWSKFQPVTVAEIPDGDEAGRYAVVDGQHRAIAALAHPLVDEVPCWIIDAPDLARQATVFVSVNRDRVAMQPIQIYRAQLAARDHDALAIDEICRAAGVTVAFHVSGGGLPPGHTQAVQTLRKLLAKHGDGPVRLALKSLASAYPDTPDQLRGQVIEATTALCAKHAGRIDEARLVKVLAERKCEDLIEAARDVKKLMGGSTTSGMVAALTSAYDKGLPETRKLAGKEAAPAASSEIKENAAVITRKPFQVHGWKPRNPDPAPPNGEFDAVIRFLRTQNDVITREGQGKYKLNARMVVTPEELLARANRILERTGKEKFPSTVLAMAS